MKDDFPSFYCKDMCILVLLLFIEFLILHVATTLETALFLAEVNLTWGSTYFNFLLYCVCPRGMGALHSPGLLCQVNPSSQWCHNCVQTESKERFIGGRKGGVPLITVFA